MNFDKIISYSVKLNFHGEIYQLKLKLASAEEPVDVNFKNVVELAVTVDLLRNEKSTFFDTNSREIIIGWEPTGENDPKYSKLSR